MRLLVHGLETKMRAVKSIDWAGFWATTTAAATIATAISTWLVLWLRRRGRPEASWELSGSVSVTGVRSNEGERPERADRFTGLLINVGDGGAYKVRIEPFSEGVFGIVGNTSMVARVDSGASADVVMGAELGTISDGVIRVTWLISPTRLGKERYQDFWLSDALSNGVDKPMRRRGPRRVPRFKRQRREAAKDGSRAI